MEYCTVADARRYMRGLTSDDVSDADITAFIVSNSASIDLYTGKTWGEHTGEVEYHDGDGFKTLKLEQYPVIMITSIEKRIYPGIWYLLGEFDENQGEGDWILDKPSNGLVRWVSGSNPSTGTRALKATYNWGYTETPDYIIELTAIMAAINGFGLAAGEKNPDDLVSINEGALSLSWGSGLYQNDIKLLTEQANAILEDAIGRRLINVPSRP